MNTLLRSHPVQVEGRALTGTNVASSPAPALPVAMQDAVHTNDVATEATTSTLGKADVELTYDPSDDFGCSNGMCSVGG